MKTNVNSLLVRLWPFLMLIILIFAFYIWTKNDQVRVYGEAEDAMASEDYDAAIEKYQALGNYKDSSEKLAEAQNKKKYNEALCLYNSGNYEEARTMFDELGDYEDSKRYLMLCSMSDYNALQEEIYNEALDCFGRGEYLTAKKSFEQIGDYKNTSELLRGCNNAIWRMCLASATSAGAVTSLAICESDLKKSGTFLFGQDCIDFNDLISVSTGVYYTIGVYSNGIARVVGDIPWYNDLKERKVENVIEGVAAADYVAFLLEDGTVWGEGYDSESTYGELIDFSNWNNIVDIDAGYHLIAGVDKNGNIYVTGRNASYINAQINARRDEWKDVYKIAVGGGEKKSEGFVVGLKKDNTVVAAGKIDEGVIGVESWTDIKDISAGDYHVVGLTTSGHLVGCLNINGETDTWAAKTCCDFSNYDNKVFVSVEAGNCTSLCVDESGTVYSFGYDHDGQIPNSELWKNVVIYSEYVFLDYVNDLK